MEGLFHQRARSARRARYDEPPTHLTTLRFLFATLLAWGTSWAPLAAATTTTGTLADGTAFRIDYPEQFNGTLLVSLDYASGNPNSAQTQALLARGFALSGTTRAVTGWDVAASTDNQVEVVRRFTAEHGPAAHRIVFGSSLGAHTGAVVVQARPDVFSGAVLMCGGLSGTVAQWQTKLDAVYVAKMLLAPDDPALPVIGIPNDFAAAARPAWLAMLAKAQQTPEGRARIALAAVIGQLPTWANPAKPKPDDWDAAALQQGLYDSLAGGPLPTIGQAMSSRNELERRSGGNISSNAGVDYGEILSRVANSDIVRQLYREASLNLDDDLRTLAKSPRYTADPQAIVWVEAGVFDGELEVPVLTVNNIGDNISAVSAQTAYQHAVDRTGASQMLRQTYVESAGHCGFSAAEAIAAVETLRDRLTTGRWDDADNPHKLNALARSLNLGAARFIHYEPAELARPFTACDLQQIKRKLRISDKPKVRSRKWRHPPC